MARATGRKYERVARAACAMQRYSRPPQNLRQGDARPHYHGTRSGRGENPLILLDEIDKLTADAHGDPASALLEVLDPEQNKTSATTSLKFPLICRSAFITTANTLDTVPETLIDRMEVRTKYIHFAREIEHRQKSSYRKTIEARMTQRRMLESPT